MEDVYERAPDWCNDITAMVVLNPLPAHLSTRDLARLIEEFGSELDRQAVQDVARAIRSLSATRDGVMHDQPIDQVPPSAGTSCRQVSKPH